MAVHVLLDFEDDGKAKEFVKEVIEDKGIYLHMEWGEHTSLVRCVPRGVWKKPTQFCDDQPAGHRADYLRRIKSKMGGWTRSKKWGWWIDPACGRPTRRWAEGGRWAYSLGNNLLPKPYALEEENLTPPEALWNDVVPSQEG